MNPLRELSLNDLVSTTQPGVVQAMARVEDDAVWEGVYQQFTGPVRRLCLRSGLSPTEAEDVMQEAFVRLHQLLRREPDPSAVFGLRRVVADLVQQLIVGLHRDRRSFLEGTRGLMATALLVSPRRDGRHPPDSEAPLWSLCIARVREQVRADHWQIFEAYAWDGLSSAEAGRLLGVTAIEVRVVHHRIVRRIQAEWRRLLSAGNLERE
jgi:DNA-directed RNA polymerase specialized sigma24 family protein